MKISKDSIHQRLTIIFVAVCIAGCASNMEKSGYKNVSSAAPAIFDLLSCAGDNESGTARQKTIVIDGVYIATGPVVRAENIRFANNSTLQYVIDRDNEYQRREECRNTVFLVADELQMDGFRSSVTWYEDEIVEIPFERGQAPGGAFGPGASLPGERGADGAKGNSGYRGLDAPTLIVVVGKSENNRLAVNLEGGTGGPGGLGQQGGDGGQGGNGTQARDLLGLCAQQPTLGGPGGPGGNGGDGGQGGTGGNGGNLFVISSSAFGGYLLEQVVTLDLDGGRGGIGGEGGVGGNGGSGGKGGQGSAPCGRSESDGLNGQPGNGGKRGNSGLEGQAGSFGFVRLSNLEFAEVISQF